MWIAFAIAVLTISIEYSMFHRILYVLGLSSAVAICCVAPRPGLAASGEQVGLTVTVRKDVSQLEPQKAKILAGDNVIRDEVIQTLDDSGAKIVLKDSTNLVLGPNSKLKLDKAVFTDEKGLGEIAVKLANGSFRFITGNGPKESYTITTPLATIGIRGTVLDFGLQALQNEVKLVEGQSRVCVRDRGVEKCVELVNPGDSAVIKAYGAERDIEVTTTTTTFDWGNMGSQMTFAAAQDVTGTIGLGGAAGVGGGTQSPPASGGPNTGLAPSGATFAVTQTTTTGFLNTGGLTGGAQITNSNGSTVSTGTTAGAPNP
jgi:hypothetical protein